MKTHTYTLAEEEATASDGSKVCFVAEVRRTGANTWELRGSLTGLSNIMVIAPMGLLVPAVLGCKLSPTPVLLHCLTDRSSLRRCHR